MAHKIADQRTAAKTRADASCGDAGITVPPGRICPKAETRTGCIPFGTGRQKHHPERFFTGGSERDAFKTLPYVFPAVGDGLRLAPQHFQHRERHRFLLHLARINVDRGDPAAAFPDPFGNITPAIKSQHKL